MIEASIQGASQIKPAAIVHNSTVGWQRSGTRRRICIKTGKKERYIEHTGPGFDQGPQSIRKAGFGLQDAANALGQKGMQGLVVSVALCMIPKTEVR